MIFPPRYLQTILSGLLLVPSCHAFVAPNSSRPQQRQRSAPTKLYSSPFLGSGSGWDNDDFLESLNSPVTPAVTPTAPEYDDAAASEDQSWGAASGGADQPTSWGAQPQQQQQQQQYQQPPQQQLQEDAAQQPPQNIGQLEVGVLPLGWSAHFDPATQQIYYYSVSTGSTQWEKPQAPDTPAGSYAVVDAAAGLTVPQDEEIATAEEIPDDALEGATLTSEMKARIKASHTVEEEESGGGHKFKEMIERAKRLQAQGGGGRPQGVAARTAAVSPQLLAEVSHLPVEQQARSIHESLWRQAHPEIQTRPSPTYLPSSIGIDGKKVGRNRETEMISNSADVYLARLKKDSTIRNLARYAGDYDKSNAVFQNEAILSEITEPEQNPYLKERRQRERDMLETVPDEMMLFQEYQTQGPPTEKERSTSGVSYKDKLEQAKARRSQQQ